MYYLKYKIVQRQDIFMKTKLNALERLIRKKFPKNIPAESDMNGMMVRD